MKFIVIVLCFLYPLQSDACVWRRMNSPFWESSRIPVCFVEPRESVSSEEQLAYDTAKQTIRSAFEREINGRTPYTTFGFENCEYNYHRQGLNGNLSPMIRIELTRARAVGSSGALGGGENISFTDARTSACNVQLDYVVRQQGRTGPIVAEQPERVQAIALHEFLHMMGLQHEEFAMEDKSRATYIVNPDYAFVPPTDPSSMMRRLPHSTRLSAQDVRCLELVHSRQILNYLPRAQEALVPEDSDTTVEP